MSSLLGVLRGFFPHRMLGWPGVGPLFVGRAVHSVGFCFAGAELASLEHLSSCNSNTWIGGCGSSHRAVGLTSWILIPYHGTGVQVGQHVRRSQMSCTLLQPPPHLPTGKASAEPGLTAPTMALHCVHWVSVAAPVKHWECLILESTR